MNKIKGQGQLKKTAKKSLVGQRSKGRPNDWGVKDRQSNQDAQSSQRERDETECPVMTGRAPHNADSTQRTEITKGTDPPQFPNEAQKGECIKLKVQDNQCPVPRSCLERVGLFSAYGGNKIALIT
jgi:hypothetical protein